MGGEGFGGPALKEAGEVQQMERQEGGVGDSKEDVEDKKGKGDVEHERKENEGNEGGGPMMTLEHCPEDKEKCLYDARVYNPSLLPSQCHRFRNHIFCSFLYFYISSSPT